MSDVVIRVEGLGKKFRIGSGQSYHRFSELLSGLGSAALNAPRQLLRRHQGNGDHPSANAKEFWALQDINFEVQQGDVVGIIGRNGAGKSTLLKILSRITEPTTGRFGIKGRVASLLEVGTGFHPELTGRENIFLSGSVLGMSHSEIKRKFDEIVDFAGVEQFLDTPVKRYSSGMQVRLGFAVAAHLESEILIVDEVLAVGDAEFQKKCLGKMDDVSQSGRTILFVSHNMGAVRGLCKTGLLLKREQPSVYSDINQAIDGYIGSNNEPNSLPLSQRLDRRGNGKARFIQLSIQDQFNTECDSVSNTQSFRIKVNFEIPPGSPYMVALGIQNAAGMSVSHLNSKTVTGKELVASGNREELFFDLEQFPLVAGYYSITAFLECDYEIADWISHAQTFEITENDFYGTGHLPPIGHSIFYPKYRLSEKCG